MLPHTALLHLNTESSQSPVCSYICTHAPAAACRSNYNRWIFPFSIKKKLSLRKANVNFTEA